MSACQNDPAKHCQRLFDVQRWWWCRAWQVSFEQLQKLGGVRDILACRVHRGSHNCTNTFDYTKTYHGSHGTEAICWHGASEAAHMFDARAAKLALN